jgi:hypothetical protein
VEDKVTQIYQYYQTLHVLLLSIICVNEAK